MLTTQDKNRFRDMIIFNANYYCNEELIMMTSRQVSQLYPVWKRHAIYVSIREIYEEEFSELFQDLYHYTIDGVKEGWICTTWYDGPRTWRNLSDTKTLNWYKDENMLSYLYLIDAKNTVVDSIVDEIVSAENTGDKYIPLYEKMTMLGYTYRLICSRNYSEYFSVTSELMNENPHWFV